MGKDLIQLELTLAEGETWEEAAQKQKSGVGKRLAPKEKETPKQTSVV